MFMGWKDILGMESGPAERETVEAGKTEQINTREPDRMTREQERPVMELSVSLRIVDESQVGRAALLLASTTGSEEEHLLKRQIIDFGWKTVATEVGGLAGELPQKITRAVVGAALNAEVVQKRGDEMHALMHAALEAMNGFISMSMLEASIGAKIGIVRNSRWIAVAVVGDTAYHAVAHHERCGLGVMHI